MKKISLLPTVLLFTQLSFAQTDSTFDKYGHLGFSFGSGLNYYNYDNLRAQGYMLGIPDNLQIFPLCASIYIGNTHKYFGSFEFGSGGQKTSGTYTDRLNTFSNMKVNIYQIRWGLYLYRNIYFGKHFAFDANIGSSLATAMINSTNEYSSSSNAIFINGKVIQDGSIYAGTMLRYFWQTKRGGDLGFTFKLGYNIPTAKASWHSTTPFVTAPPEVNISGLTANLSVYMWNYNAKWVMKNMPPNPYFYPQKIVVDTTPAPTDSTKSVFKMKKTKYSYIQWDEGYTGMNLKGEWKNGFDMSLTGVVFSKKYSTSLGIIGYVDNAPNTFGNPLPKVDSYIGVYWNNEYLLHPDNMINFSFPLKIAYIGASGWSTDSTVGWNQAISNWNFTGKNYYNHDGMFWTVSPGANVFINLFKPLSLGVGANYRFAFGVPKILGTDSDFSSYSVLVFLRIKFDTKAMNKRMMERQKAYWDNAPKK